MNLLFEMQDLSNPSIFRPVLDYYDSLATPIGQPPSTNTGPVMTGVNTAFYYTVATTGMTIEEHDAHLQALFDGITPEINNVNDKINFLHTDWQGRMPAIQSQVGDVFTPSPTTSRPRSTRCSRRSPKSSSRSPSCWGKAAARATLRPRTTSPTPGTR